MDPEVHRVGEDHHGEEGPSALRVHLAQTARWPRLARSAAREPRTSGFLSFETQVLLGFCVDVFLSLSLSLFPEGSVF